MDGIFFFFHSFLLTSFPALAHLHCQSLNFDSLKADRFYFLFWKKDLSLHAFYANYLNSNLKFLTMKCTMHTPGYSSYFTRSEIWGIRKDKLEGEQFMEALGHELSLEKCRRLRWALRGRRCGGDKETGYAKWVWYSQVIDKWQGSMEKIISWSKMVDKVGKVL